MHATRAYIAGAGTAVVMLGASLCTFALVSAFVTFGTWPGAQSHTTLDRVVLRDVAEPRAKPIAVRADAVAVARRSARRAVQQSAVPRRGVARVAPATPVAKAPPARGAPTTPSATTPAAPATRPQQTPVQQPAQDVARNVTTTTGDVTTQVQQQAQTVQTQVNEVVGQVIGGPQADQNGPVQQVTDAVKKTAGSLLGGG